VRRDLGCGVLIIEHDMRMIASLCDRVQVLASGRVLAVGTPAEVSRDVQVVEAFLGKEAAHEWAQG
jgi:branched-chain amino acid transport system ATP-binding protein